MREMNLEKREIIIGSVNLILQNLIFDFIPFKFRNYLAALFLTINLVSIPFHPLPAGRQGVKIQGNVDLRINLILLLNNYEISSIKKLLHPK